MLRARLELPITRFQGQCPNHSANCCLLIIINILGFHMTSRRPCWCTEQYWKKSFGNFILLLCKRWATFCHCFVHQHGRLITWVKTKNNRIPWTLVPYPGLSAKWRVNNWLIQLADSNGFGWKLALNLILSRARDSLWDIHKWVHAMEVLISRHSWDPKMVPISNWSWQLTGAV